MLVGTVRILLCCSLCLLAAAVGCNASSSARATRPKARIAGCDAASLGRFEGASASPGNQQIGPLRLLFAGGDAAAASVGDLRRLGGWKMPALLQPGHTVTLVIDSSRRRVSGWTYGPRRLTPRAGIPAQL